MSDDVSETVGFARLRWLYSNLAFDSDCSDPLASFRVGVASSKQKRRFTGAGASLSLFSHLYLLWLEASKTPLFVGSVIGSWLIRCRTLTRHTC